MVLDSWCLLTYDNEGSVFSFNKIKENLFAEARSSSFLWRPKGRGKKRLEIEPKFYPVRLIFQLNVAGTSHVQ